MTADKVSRLLPQLSLWLPSQDCKMYLQSQCIFIVPSALPLCWSLFKTHLFSVCMQPSYTWPRGRGLYLEHWPRLETNCRRQVSLLIPDHEAGVFTWNTDSDWRPTVADRSAFLYLPRGGGVFTLNTDPDWRPTVSDRWAVFQDNR
jgi:hypothetical protein